MRALCGGHGALEYIHQEEEPSPKYFHRRHPLPPQMARDRGVRGGQAGNTMSMAVLGGTADTSPKNTTWPAAIWITSSHLVLQISWKLSASLSS